MVFFINNKIIADPSLGRGTLRIRLGPLNVGRQIMWKAMESGPAGEYGIKDGQIW